MPLLFPWNRVRPEPKPPKHDTVDRILSILEKMSEVLRDLAGLIFTQRRVQLQMALDIRQLLMNSGVQPLLQFSIPNLNIQGSFMSQTINKTTFDAAGGKLPYHLTGHKSTNPNVPIDSVQSVTSSDTNIATVEQDPSDPTKLHVGWVGEGNVTIEAIAVIQGKTEKAQLDLTLVEEPQLTIDEG